MKKDSRDRHNDDEHDEAMPTMKPKNRVMCPDCGKPKMLFETERKANDFIRWNGDSLDKTHNVLRAYYCPSCCGWHISHKYYRESYENRTDELIHAYREQKKSLTKIDKIVRSKEYEEQVKRTEKESRRIFDELPAEVQKTRYKSTIKNHVSQYLKANGITDPNGALRTAIYKLWKEKNK